MKTCRAWVVVPEAMVVQCDLKFEDYDGPARVIKSASNHYVSVDTIVSQFDWCVIRDAYIARASHYAKQKVAEATSRVEGHRDDIKRMGGANYLEDAVKRELQSIENWKDIVRKIHNEGPTLWRFEETL